MKRALVPIEAAHATARLAVPFEPGEWLAERKTRLAEGLERLAAAARHGMIPGGAIENGVLRIGRPASVTPEDADALVLDLYRRLPEVRITDILLEADTAIGIRNIHFAALHRYRLLVRCTSPVALDIARDRGAEGAPTRTHPGLAIM